MPGPKLSKNLGTDGVAMLLDVRTPVSLLHGALVLGADVEEGKLS